jgi:transposase
VEYFGGVSAVVVPDQLRTGVTDPCRYEPTIQRTYADWARHYGTAIVPARPAKPRDKAYASYCTSLVGCVADRRARSHRAIPFEA